MDATWKAHYHIEITISKCSMRIQAGFSRVNRVRESIFERGSGIWRLLAPSMTLSKISPETGSRQNNVLPSKGKRHANRRSCSGPQEVGIYTRNDASMQMSIDWHFTKSSDPCNLEQRPFPYPVQWVVVALLLWKWIIMTLPVLMGLFIIPRDTGVLLMRPLVVNK